MKAAEPQKLYSIPEVAKMLRVSRQTVDRYHREFPDFPRKVRLAGAGSVRFVAEEFDAWLLKKISEGAA